MFVFPPVARAKKGMIDSLGKAGFRVFQRVPGTIASILPYAVTPVTQRLNIISIFIHSFIYFRLLEAQRGYFAAASFVSVMCASPFYHWRSDNFFCQPDADGTSRFSSQSVLGLK